MFHFLVHIRNACNSQGQARNKPGSPELHTQFSHIHSRGSVFELSPCFPKYALSGHWIRSRGAETQPRHLNTGCEHPQWQPNPLCHLAHHSPGIFNVGSTVIVLTHLSISAQEYIYVLRSTSLIFAY